MLDKIREGNLGDWDLCLLMSEMSWRPLSSRVWLLLFICFSPRVFWSARPFFVPFTEGREDFFFLKSSTSSFFLDWTLLSAPPSDGFACSLLRELLELPVLLTVRFTLLVVEENRGPSEFFNLDELAIAISAWFGRKEFAFCS